jgi:outer membrane protein
MAGSPIGDCARLFRSAAKLPLAALALTACVAGCAGVRDQVEARPEISPYQSAPHSMDRQWTPARPLPSGYVLANRAPDAESTEATALNDGRTYDLADLIDIALQNNPHTSAAWQNARAAAAEYGAAQAPYYPQASVESDNGYERTMIELPNAAGTLKQWQADPAVTMTWTLIDFGRRRSASDAARARLIAANFGFSRAIQDVVFDTQSAFYARDAAEAAVVAAQQNLQLAQTDLEAAQQRVDLGLATAPELLLTKARAAQARFDLANANLLVHDAEAQLAVALGVPANREIRIQSLETQGVPESLNATVDTIITAARRERPDLAAQLANLRASEAAVDQAESEFYPVLNLSAGYGEDLWNFSLQTPQTVNVGEPQYSAMLSVRWELFTGFSRLNGLRRAQAAREASRAAFRASAIDTVAEVWRAYFEFDSSRSKYDYAQSLLAASQESYDANLETYRQGLSTIVELLTAERDLANARYTLIQSKAELLTAYAAVAYAAGAAHIPSQP